MEIKVPIGSSEDYFPKRLSVSYTNSSLNQYEQIMEYLKNNPWACSDRITRITVHGGSYFLVGFNAGGGYSAYIAFSYWDNTIVKIRQTGGTWSYSVLS